MTEEVKFWYLFWAYAIIWILMGGYLMTLGARLRSARREIDRLRGAQGREERG